nr:MAG TPA: hypothetical protein [Caudoviricetes sp.]
MSLFRFVLAVENCIFGAVTRCQRVTGCVC